MRIGQFANLLGQVPRGVWTALITATIMLLLNRAASKPMARDDDGWIALRPTLGLVALSVFASLMAVLFAIASFIAVVVWAQDGFHAESTTVLLACVAPPMTALFGYCAGYTVAVGHRFNPDGYERTVFGRRRFISWPEIWAIRRHWLYGPVLELHTGHRLMLPEYYRGFQQLVRQAESGGAFVDLAE